MDPVTISIIAASVFVGCCCLHCITGGQIFTCTRYDTETTNQEGSMGEIPGYNAEMQLAAPALSPNLVAVLARAEESNNMQGATIAPRLQTIPEEDSNAQPARVNNIEFYNLTSLEREEWEQVSNYSHSAETIAVTIHIDARIFSPSTPNQAAVPTHLASIDNNSERYNLSVLENGQASYSFPTIHAVGVVHNHLSSGAE